MKSIYIVEIIAVKEETKGHSASVLILGRDHLEVENVVPEPGLSPDHHHAKDILLGKIRNLEKSKKKKLPKNIVIMLQIQISLQIQNKIINITIYGNIIFHLRSKAYGR